MKILRPVNVCKAGLGGLTKWWPGMMGYTCLSRLLLVKFSLVDVHEVWT